MANWKRKVHLQPEWGQAQEGEITIQQLASVVSKRLRAVRDFGIDHLDNDRDEIADEFEGLSEDSNARTSDFDAVMHRLYDWGDTALDGKWNGSKVCWIDTIGIPTRQTAGV